MIFWTPRTDFLCSNGGVDFLQFHLAMTGEFKV